MTCAESRNFAPNIHTAAGSPNKLMLLFFRKIWQYLLWLGVPLSRHGLFFCVLTGLAVSTCLIIGRPGSEHTFYAFQLSIDLYVICFIFCLLPKKIGVPFKYGVYTVAYLLAVVECFLFMRFRLTFSPSMLNLLLETNGNEAGEFLGICRTSKEFWKSLGIFSSIFALNVLLGIRGGKAFRRGAEVFFRDLHKARWAANGIKRAGLSVLVLALITANGRAWWGEKQKMIEFFGNTHTRQAEDFPEYIFFTSFYRLIHATHFLNIARQETENLMSRMGTLQVDACTATCPNIVVIIGESYNKHHAQIYGYPLETTPNLARLKSRGTLHVFTDVVTPWNLTSNCFKSFLSTHSGDQPGTWADGVLFPTLFRRAGYKVAFVTNQFYRSAAQGSIDFNGSFFLNDERMDSLCFDFRNRFRSRSEAEITKLLQRFQPGERNLYLLHLYGQHMEYHRRYPGEKTRFTTADIQRPDLTEEQRQIVAHYDNATRYNDEVIASIFTHFKNEDAIVLYFSDHGEEVYDGESGIYGRNHTPTPQAEVLRYEYEIPFMIWTTPSFRKKHPAVVRSIRRALDRPFSHDDLPHLLMGLAGIRSPHYDEQRDLLSEKFRPHTRWIKQTVDYDKAMRTNLQQ